MVNMNVTIIGSGFAGLSSAAVLASKGYNVRVIEKHNQIGGRARQFNEKGYNFDMGPSWYWMPDVFDQFFNQFQKSTKDYYELLKLDPGFQIIFEDQKNLVIPAQFEKLESLFNKIEPGSSKMLKKFMQEAEFKYSFGMSSVVFQPGISWMEFCKLDLFKNVFRLQILSSYKNHVAKYFKHPKLRALLEFPVLFLGTAPKDTPALYSLMAYSGLIQGTFYPMGGFHQVIKGMGKLCVELGVSFNLGQSVEEIEIKNSKVYSVKTEKKSYLTDILIGSADYHHIEKNLLPKSFRNYSENYWSKKTFSPSCLLFYLGINKKLKKIIHHNLFFDANIEQHIDEVYSKKVWPKNPLFYACCPSKTDPFTAPKNKENIFLLIPITPGLEDSKDLRDYYFNLILKRLENYCGENISDFIEYKKDYCINDFIYDYNAYKGNAYGLANTLFQTANFKPSIINKKLPNLFYTGQLTVPGPGVPPSLISGQIVAKHITENFPLS